MFNLLKSVVVFFGFRLGICNKFRIELGIFFLSFLS